MFYFKPPQANLNLYLFNRSASTRSTRCCRVTGIEKKKKHFKKPCFLQAAGRQLVFSSRMPHYEERVVWIVAATILTSAPSYLEILLFVKLIEKEICCRKKTVPSFFPPQSVWRATLPSQKPLQPGQHKLLRFVFCFVLFFHPCMWGVVASRATVTEPHNNRNLATISATLLSHPGIRAFPFIDITMKAAGP